MKHVKVLLSGLLITPVHENARFRPVFVARQALQRLRSVHIEHIHENPYLGVVITLEAKVVQPVNVGAQTAVAGAGLLCGGSATTTTPKIPKSAEYIETIVCHRDDIHEVVAEIMEAVESL